MKFRKCFESWSVCVCVVPILSWLEDSRLDWPEKCVRARVAPRSRWGATRRPSAIVALPTCNGTVCTGIVCNGTVCTRQIKLNKVQTEFTFFPLFKMLRCLNLLDYQKRIQTELALSLIKKRWDFKGTVPRDFDPCFFQRFSVLTHLGPLFKYVRIWFRFRGDNRIWNKFSSVIDCVKKKRLNVLKIFLGDFIFFLKHADSEELELFFHHDLWKILKVKQLSLQMLII